MKRVKPRPRKKGKEMKKRFRIKDLLKDPNGYDNLDPKVDLPPDMWPEEAFTGFRWCRYQYSTSFNESIYDFVIEFRGKFWKGSFTTYDQAGFTDLGELYLHDKEAFLDLEECKRVAAAIDINYEVV